MSKTVPESTSSHSIEEESEVVAGNGAAAATSEAPTYTKREPVHWTNFTIGDLPPFLWDGLIHEGEMVVIAGTSKAGKTHYTLRLSLAFARGEKFCGRQARKTSVYYLVLEGKWEVVRRLLALQKHLEITEKEAALIDIRIDDAAFDLREIGADGDVTALRDYLNEQIPSGAVVVIDTYNRAMPGGKEGAEEASLALAASRMLQEGGHTVIFNHHFGKDTERGMRGHTALPAGLDVEMHVTKTGDFIQVSVAELRSGKPPSPDYFELVPVALGEDNHGHEVEAAIISERDAEDSAPAFQKERREAKKARVSTEQIAVVIEQMGGAAGKTGSPLRRVDLVEGVKKAHPGIYTSASGYRTRVHRALTELKKSGVVTLEEPKESPTKIFKFERYDG